MIPDRERSRRVVRPEKGEVTKLMSYPRDDIEERIRNLRRRYLKRLPLFEGADRDTAYERGERQI